MRTDIICAEGELSVAANKIADYADFLSRTIDSYISILSEIQQKGIQDDLICSRLSAIAQSLEPYKTAIREESDGIAMDIREYITGVSRADNFRFPNDISLTIASIVASFL